MAIFLLFPAQSTSYFSKVGHTKLCSIFLGCECFLGMYIIQDNHLHTSFSCLNVFHQLMFIHALILSSSSTHSALKKHTHSISQTFLFNPQKQPPYLAIVPNNGKLTSIPWGYPARYLVRIKISPNDSTPLSLNVTTTVG